MSNFREGNSLLGGEHLLSTEKKVDPRLISAVTTRNTTFSVPVEVCTQQQRAGVLVKTQVGSAGNTSAMDARDFGCERCGSLTCQTRNGSSSFGVAVVGASGVGKSGIITYMIINVVFASTSVFRIGRSKGAEALD